MIYTKTIESVIEKRQLEWDTSGLALENIVKLSDGNRLVSASLGTLKVSGALPGDSVTLSYASGIARLLSDAIGDNIPALISFEQTALDNGNYALPGEAAFSFAVRHIPTLNDAKAPVPSSYTGQQLKPTVAIGGLVEGEDYEVTDYGENINVGVGQVHISGKGALSGTSVTLSFEILAAALPQPGAIGAQSFTGAALTPDVSIPGLVKGTDFTVQYKNNVDIGTAEIILTGIGNYSGERRLSFTITDKPVEPPAEPQIAPIEGPADDGPAPALNLVTEPDGDTAAYEQRSISLPLPADAEPGAAAPRLLLLQAAPEQDEDGAPVYRPRSLNLTRDSVNALIAQGYSRVCLMLGDVAVFIDLGALTTGDYTYTLEPVGDGSTGVYRLRIMRDGVEVTEMDDGVTLAFATQDAQGRELSIQKLDENGDGVEQDTDYMAGLEEQGLPAFYTAQLSSSGTYALQNG